MKVLGISGSLQRTSYNTAAVRAAQELAPAGMEIEIYVFSNLKTWGLGVYHGLRRKHLKAYLDEFTFRFNRRRTRHAAFAALLGFGAIWFCSLFSKPVESLSRALTEHFTDSVRIDS
jgi:ISXO2 transposase-like protein/NADPH-dependent FMN reductase